MAKRLFQRNAPETIKDANEMSEEAFIKKYTEETYSTAILVRDMYRAVRKEQSAARPAESQLPEGKKVTFKVVKENSKQPTSKKTKIAAGGQMLESAILPEKATSPKITAIEDISFEEISGGLTDEELRELAELEAIADVDQALPETTSNVEGDKNPIANTSQAYDSITIHTSEGSFVAKNVSIEYIEDVAAALGGEKMSDEAAGNTVKEYQQLVGLGKRSRGRQRLSNADERDKRILQLLKTDMPGKAIVLQMKSEGFSVHAPQVSAIKQKWENEKAEELNNQNRTNNMSLDKATSTTGI